MTANKLKDANIATQSLLKDEIISAQNSVFYSVANALCCLNPIFEKIKHDKENSIFIYEDYCKLRDRIKTLSDVQKWKSISSSTQEYLDLIKRNEALLEMLNPE